MDAGHIYGACPKEAGVSSEAGVCLDAEEFPIKVCGRASGQNAAHPPALIPASVTTGASGSAWLYPQLREGDIRSAVIYSHMQLQLQQMQASNNQQVRVHVHRERERNAHVLIFQKSA
jgi:hypothetical protein